MKKIFFNIFILSILTVQLLAQSVEFKATAPKVVAVDEQFEMVFEVNAQGAGFRPPDLNDFAYSGPMTSSSMNTSIVNGQISQEVSYSFTYVMQPKKEGKFTIKPAEITVKGKKYTSNSLVIEVAKGNSSPNNQSSGNQQQTDAGIDVNNSELFIRVDVDKTSVFQGESLVATVKIYTKLKLDRLGEMKFPTFDGFWTQDISPKQVTLERENVGGVVYNTVVIKQMILFPQLSGDISIGVAEAECYILKKVRPVNWFDNGYREVVQKIKSNPKTIKVKALPANKPASFYGAVGNFKMETSIDKQDVKTNDGITLKVTISGSGNLKLIEVPKVKFPPDFEVYDPKIDDKLSNSGSGMSGSKVVEYLIIPRNAGDFTIEPVTFSYFDTKGDRYVTLTSNEYKIHVEKGASDTTRIISSYGKTDVQIIGSDIRFIKTGKVNFTKKGDFLYGSNLFYFAYLIPLLIFIIFFVIYRKKVQESANLQLVKNKRANKISKKRLRVAANYLKENNKKLFFEEILKALWGYLSDKLNIPISELHKENIKETLVKHNIDEELINSFLEVLNTCEYAQYAPLSDEGQMDRTYNEASTVISKLEQKLK